MREIHTHESPCPTPAAEMTIRDGEGGPGSAPVLYAVQWGEPAEGVRLEFRQVNKSGLTNEALLAVLIDRLEQFQDGQFPCKENEAALRHLRGALESLHARTARRLGEGTEGKLVEKQNQRARVTVDEAGGTVTIGTSGLDINVPLDKLRSSWAAWGAVESALKLFNPPPTPEEWAVLEGLATAAAARNGLAETRQAVAQAVRKKEGP